MTASFGAGEDRRAALALRHYLSHGPYDKIDSLLALLNAENTDILFLLTKDARFHEDGGLELPSFFQGEGGEPSAYGEYSFWTALGCMREKPLWLHGVEQVRFRGAPPGEAFRIPPMVTALPKLKHLALEECGLEHLPEELLQMRKLRGLSLRGNRLKSIPAGIGRLRQLMYFNAAENELEHLPAQMGHLKKLTVLDLSGNRLRSTGFSFDDLTCLNRLNLSGNALEEVPSGLEFLNQLEHVDLSFNDLTADEEAAWESGHSALIKNYQWHFTF